MQAKTSLSCAAIAGFLAVALGAFGAHALKGLLSGAALGWWQTAVQYHLVHAAVLLGIGLWQQLQPQKWLSYAAQLMLAGLLLFSGSLYLLALSDLRWLGAITPIGGSCWLLGWGMLLICARKLTKS